MPTFINKEEERKATKFRNMLSRQPTSQLRYNSEYITDRGYSTRRLGDPKEYQKALTLRNSMENSAAKIIRLRASSKQPTAYTEQSTIKSTYADSRQIKSEITKYSPDDFQCAFEEAAVNGEIRLENIVSVVRSVMGEDVPLWILNKFTALGHQHATYKKISWSLFRCIIENVQEIVERESSLCGKNIPDWINGRPPTSSGLVTYRHKSSYMSDLSEDRLINYNDMRLNASKTASTRDLFSGTTKDTYQLPGYSGHIPVNSNNVKKALHSQGENPRPQPCYLRLVSERLGSVPNYSGYIPLSTGLSGERTTGMNPLTTTGAAYGRNK